MPTYMNSKTERECNVCGYRCYASQHCPCPTGGCSGIMCAIITPLPGKRVSGVLCRDKTRAGYHNHEIRLILGVSLTDITLLSCGTWKWPYGKITYRHWTTEQWRAQYGKLPRKGSKQMVIIELTSNGE